MVPSSLHCGRKHAPLSDGLLAVSASDWAYLAGIVDGEGHFNAALGTNSFGIVLKMAEPEVVRWAYATFGGSARLVPRRPPRRDTYVWTLQRARDLEVVCTRLLPHLRLKTDECAAMLDAVQHSLAKPTSTADAAAWKYDLQAKRDHVRHVRNTRKASTLNGAL